MEAQVAAARARLPPPERPDPARSPSPPPAPAGSASPPPAPAGSASPPPAPAGSASPAPAPVRSPSPASAARLAVAAERAEELQDQARQMRTMLEEVSRSLAAVRQARQVAQEQLEAAAEAGLPLQLTQEELEAAELRAVRICWRPGWVWYPLPCLLACMRWLASLPACLSIQGGMQCCRTVQGVRAGFSSRLAGRHARCKPWPLSGALCNRSNMHRAPACSPSGCLAATGGGGGGGLGGGGRSLPGCAGRFGGGAAVGEPGAMKGW